MQQCVASLSLEPQTSSGEIFFLKLKVQFYTKQWILSGKPQLGEDGPERPLTARTVLSTHVTSVRLFPFSGHTGKPRLGLEIRNSLYF